jgi:hypothetical protein
MINSGEDHPCDSDDRSLFTSSFINMFLFGFEVRRFG